MGRNVHYPHADPRFGFEFGSMRVTRMTDLPRYHVIAVDTEHRHVQIAASPTGRSVRVWIDGVEVTARAES